MNKLMKWFKKNQCHETINTSEFSFTVSEELEKIKWNRFEIYSVMD